VELGLIIIYKLQFQVVSLWRIKLLRSRSKQIRSFSFDARLADGYFVLPYTRRLFITRHKMGPISTDSEFEAAEKELRAD
jgi:hypothetical protein